MPNQADREREHSTDTAANTQLNSTAGGTASGTAHDAAHGAARGAARGANAADWELVVRSPFLKKLAFFGVVVVMLVHILMAVVVGIGDTGVAVTTTDRLGFIGIGLLFSLVCLTLLRPRVRVNSAGVEVRNIANAQFYPWEIVHGLSFPTQAQTARLELPDFEFVPMMAMHVRDRNTIAGTVEAFRKLEDRYMPDE